MESFKNREGVMPVGARVRRAAKMCPYRGVVVAVSERGMTVHWDGQRFPAGTFMPCEIRRA